LAGAIIPDRGSTFRVASTTIRGVVTDVVIEKRKWDGSVSARWPARLDEDGARTVWRTPAGTLRLHPRTGREEVVERLEVAATCGRGWIVSAIVDGDGGLVRGEAVRDGVLAFIDIDLDLDIRGGEAVVRDLIEFAERREEMGYPPGLLSSAVIALDDALGRHRRGEWPFDRSLLEDPGD